MKNTKQISSGNVEKKLLQEQLERYEEEQGNRDKYKKVVQSAIAHWYKCLRDGKIEFKSVSDLEQLLELEQKLRGEDL
ncbi:hypothetical protein P4V72_05715 [Bacillus thuringiensis]|uniref:Uncharacterized protein n=2 Tax=root TaxID=1 RepID=A0A4P8MXN1_9CAUD|nr:hypothetical protein [Bacillus thuringiensis]YP_009845505.1 hypothetical protein HWC18_gp69 [Bacillus phage vB_BtS_B83]MEB9095235.1 hypothetical protein [Bacillus cereus]AQY42403.1 hypothetical protein B4918_31365 [Bacillus thuringiensis]MDR4148518.1 hypothetical protein [Bacillus thuringiensis]MEC3575096.1 hypothetical protein [Bacillus thuringiensis]MED2019889.1 hypothetical protein [Bacillus thuringiensis]